MYYILARYNKTINQYEMLQTTTFQKIDDAKKFIKNNELKDVVIMLSIYFDLINETMKKPRIDDDSQPF